MDRKYCDICGCEITELPHIIELRHDGRIDEKIECCSWCEGLIYNIIKSVSSFGKKGL